MIKDNDGVITLFSGDTGDIILGGFNPEHNYMVYLQFSDEDGKFIGEQMALETNYSDSVSFHLPAAISDKLTVPLGEDYQLYYLGGKRSEIVKTYIDLYAWDDSGLLYTHVLSPVVGEKTYNAENEETEYTVSSIESIVYENEAYTKDAENNINEYRTDYYAWKNSDTIVYTNTDTPGNGSLLYDENGDEINYTVSSSQNLYYWGGIANGAYTLSESPNVGDNVYDKYGTMPNTRPQITEVGENYIVYTYTVQGSVYTRTQYRDIEGDTRYIHREPLDSPTNLTRSIDNDIKTPISVIAYAWTLEETSIYTMGENPLTGDILYNSELEDIGTVDAINSVIINSNEYERSADDDIHLLVSTDYITEDTIIPELGGKKPVIVYRKVAEGPV